MCQFAFDTLVMYFLQKGYKRKRCGNTVHSLSKSRNGERCCALAGAEKCLDGLKCTCSHDWSVVSCIDAGYNRIPEIERADARAMVTILHLQGNMLHVVDAKGVKQQMPNLKLLDVSNQRHGRCVKIRGDAEGLVIETDCSATTSLEYTTAVTTSTTTSAYRVRRRTLPPLIRLLRTSAGTIIELVESTPVPASTGRSSTVTLTVATSTATTDCENDHSHNRSRLPTVNTECKGLENIDFDLTVIDGVNFPAAIYRYSVFSTAQRPL